MKKTFTIMLSLIMALSLCLTACGDNSSSTETDSSAATESTAAESTEPQLFKELNGTYGSSKEDLALYNEGPYAYWLAAGILTDRDEQMVENVINLFCEENLSIEE